MTAARVPLSPEASAYCWTVVCEPDASGRELRSAWVELAMAGEVDWDPLRDRDVPPPWARGGRWP